MVITKKGNFVVLTVSNNQLNLFYRGLNLNKKQKRNLKRFYKLNNFIFVSVVEKLFAAINWTSASSANFIIACVAVPSIIIA